MTKREWEKMLQYFEEDEEVSEESILDYERSLAEQAEYNRMVAEENTLAYAWQDDMMFLWRFER